MGVVYLAWQVNLSRQTAIKMLNSGVSDDSRYLLRFMAEAEATASLKHPHIAQVYDFGIHEDRPYLAMEYCPGETLAERLQNGSKLDPKSAAALLLKLCSATRAAHDSGIIHRDIKPGNIIFDTQDQPKLVDFGLAERQGGNDLTHTQAILGTPAYMAPEQGRGDTKFVGPTADIYSLGVVLYECLTGTRPFTHEDTMALLRMVSDQPPERLRSRHKDIPRDLELICLKCLEKDSAKRYQTAAALEADLKAFLAGEPVTARPAPVHEQTLRWIKRHPAIATAAGLGVAASFVFFGLIAYNNQQLKTALQQAEQQKLRAEASEAATLENQNALVKSTEKRLRDVDNLVDNMNLRLSSENLNLAIEFLTETIAINEQMLTEDSSNVRLINAMIRHYESLGQYQQSSNEAADAKASYKRADDLMQKLASQNPDNTLNRKWAGIKKQIASLAESNGDCLEAAKYFDQAGSLFLKASDEESQTPAKLASLECRILSAMQFANDHKVETMQQRLMELQTEAQQCTDEFSESALAWYCSGKIAHASAFAAMVDQPNAATEYLLSAIDDFRKCKQLDKTSYNNALRNAHNDLAHFAIHRQDHQILASIAPKFAKDFPEDYDGSFYAATRLCHAVASLRHDTPDFEAVKSSYINAAVTFLNQCVSEGFTSRAWYLLDPELAPVHEHPSFQEFLVNLNAYDDWADPEAEDYYSSLIDIYNYTTFYESKEELTFMDLKRAELAVVNRNWFWNKANDLAELFIGDPYSFNFSYVVIGNADPKRDPDEEVEVKRALSIAKKFTHLPEFSNLAKLISDKLFPESESLLIEAYKHEKRPFNKADYLLKLAVVQELKAAEAEIGSDEQTKAYDRAIRIYEKLKTEYGSIPSSGYQNMAENAEKQTARVKLTVRGRTAPIVSGVDLNGQPLSTEDFLGKVMALDFWASWCPPCRSMVPRIKETVEKFKDQPFVWVGVNSDSSESLPRVRQLVEELGITWQSLHDVDHTIGKQWNITGIPRIVLINHEGVIINDWTGLGDKPGDELDAAIEKALAAMEPSKSREESESEIMLSQ